MQLTHLKRLRLSGPNIVHFESMLAVFVTVLLFTAFTAGAGELVVRVHGVDSDRGGRILAGIYSSEVGYLKPGYEIAGIVIDIGDDAAMVGVFKNLPTGDYVVAVVHDEDGDGKIDSGFLNIPTEGYGFSRLKKAPLGRPAFDRAAVHVKSSGRNSTDVHMRYL